MLKGLVKIANRLDDLGLTKEADVIDAALRKLAAIEGLPGGEYQNGRMVNVVPNGPTAKFYSASPSSMQKLNSMLSKVVYFFGEHDKFPRELRMNPPKASDTSWTKSTEDAFDAFAKLVGAGKAGENWVEYALQNKYAPSVDGITAFVEDHLEEADNAFQAFQKNHPAGPATTPRSREVASLPAPKTTPMPVQPPAGLKPAGPKGQVTTLVGPPKISDKTTSTTQLGLSKEKIYNQESDMIAQTILNRKDVSNSFIDAALANMGYKREMVEGVMKAVRME